MKDVAANKRIFGLDILRAAAIFFVMEIHGLRFISAHTNTHYYWLTILDGVDLFFVLSGFLIGGILIRTINDKGLTASQLFNFWSRRWFRTLPNYFLILFVLIIFSYREFHTLPRQVWQFFFFTQCLAYPQSGFFPESWSLAVEEWFYLLVPIGFFFLLSISKNKKKMILIWIITVIVASTVFRIYKVYAHLYEGEDLDVNIRKQVATRMDSIMYGFLGAYLNHYKFFAWQKRKNLLLITGLLILFGSRVLGVGHILYFKYCYIAVYSIGTLCLLPKLSSMVNGKGIFYRVITFISIISYSMYLLNYTLVSWIILPKISHLTGTDYTKSVTVSVINYLLFLDNHNRFVVPAV